MRSLNRDIVSICRPLCESGYDSASPCVSTITEGRTKHPGYAWCGDFVTFVMRRAGVTDGALLNREELNHQWRIGRNIADLMSRSTEVGSCAYGVHALHRLASDPDGCVGCPVVFERTGGGHVGIIAEVHSTTTIVTFDGNGLYGKTGVNVRRLDADQHIHAIIDVAPWDTPDRFPDSAGLASCGLDVPPGGYVAPQPEGLPSFVNPVSSLLEMVRAMISTPQRDEVPDDSFYSHGDFGMKEGP